MEPVSDGLSDQYRAGIRTALEAFPKVAGAVLFGSRAMGNFRNASDVDLTLEGTDITLADLLSIKAKIRQLNLPIEVDLVIRRKIDNPELEQHIRDFGRQWYLRKL